jgi:hypothetical protein
MSGTHHRHAANAANVIAQASTAPDESVNRSKMSNQGPSFG